MKARIKYIALAVIIVGSLALAYNFYRQPTAPRPELMTYNQLISSINQGEIKSAKLKQTEVIVGLSNDQIYRVIVVPGLTLTNLADKIAEKNPAAVVEFELPEAGMGMADFLLLIFALLCLLGFIGLLRHLRGGFAFNFGKSQAKLVSENQKRITFKDVAGVDEAQDELCEVVDFLRNPHRFQELGGRIPKGVLLMGPPGTGKTLLARAIAGEANVPFFSISGSDFVEMFVGVGASRVRNLFSQAKKKAPCIIFIDEIDSVGRQRGPGVGGGHDEREQTLNQLLVEMDGFEANDGVILIASTNRPDILDSALLRPGRFDRRVMVNRPDVKGRAGILAVHTSRTPLASDVDINVIARGTPGFTGADLANLVNEAALNAARFKRKSVTMTDFELAKDKVLMGAERRSVVISDEEKRSTAYHEAGHTLVGLKVPNADPVHKVTIIPRGMALGVTMQLPQGDRYLHTREYIEGQIAILMGGRVAEEVFFNQMTTGASNDIERATELARKMVCEYGMSNLGPITFKKNDDGSQPDYSPDTAIKIDQEVSRIITEHYNRARQIILEHTEAMVRLSEALLEHESLDSIQINCLVDGKPVEFPELTPTELTASEELETETETPVYTPVMPPTPDYSPATA